MDGEELMCCVMRLLRRITTTTLRRVCVEGGINKE